MEQVGSPDTPGVGSGKVGAGKVGIGKIGIGAGKINAMGAGKGKGKGKEGAGKYYGKGKEGTKRVRSISQRCDLFFPVGRLRRLCISYLPGHMKSSPSYWVFLTAVLEYVFMEMLELASHACVDSHKKRITPRHVRFAINGDHEYDQLFVGSFPQAGVIPHIHKDLLKKKDEDKKSGK